MSAPLIRRAAVLLALALPLGPRPLQAAGFSIYEQGGRGMGFAGAFTAIADDPSAIFHNPAGIAFLKGKQIYLGATLVHPSSDFFGDDPYPGAGVTETGDVGVIPVPTLYYTHQVSERLVLGAGVSTPYGLKTAWANPDTFTGRFLSIEADLKSFSLNPTLAYKLADRFSIAVGLDIRLSKVTLLRRVPATHPVTRAIVDVAEASLESDYKSGVGFNVGLLAKPSDNLSLGAGYRHKVQVSYEGTGTFTQISTGLPPFDAVVAAGLPQGPTPITTAIEFPSITSGGFSYNWTDWRIAGDVVFFQWSTFDQLPIRFPEYPRFSQDIIEDYENSWQFRAGVERRLGEAWAVRAGYFFDQSPSPAESVSPLLPDADRNGFTLGGSWHNESLRVDVGAWYLAFKDRSTEGVNRDGYNGTYRNSALTFGASLGYQF
jgi:long-chain fatty acid transport protein